MGIATGAAIAGGVAAAATAGAGIVGSIQSSKDKAKARGAMQQALAEIESIGAGPDLAREIILEKFNQVGILTPELEQNVNMHVSQVANIKEDDSLRDAQKSALQLLKDRSEVGLTSEDKAAYGELRDRVQQDLQGQRGQILQQMQQRGMGGSGAELMAQLQATQGAANQQARGADDVAAEASRRALDSLSRYGGQAAELRGQDFNVNNAKAQAADELSRFNVQNQMAIQARNVASRNAANEANLAGQQAAANQNTAMTNAELNRQRDAEQQMYANKQSNAQMKANALAGQAGQYQQAAQNTAQNWANIGSGTGAAIGALGNYFNKPDKKKTE